MGMKRRWNYFRAMVCGTNSGSLRMGSSLILHLASAWTSMVAVSHRNFLQMVRRRNCSHAAARPTRGGRWAAHPRLLCKGGLPALRSFLVVRDAFTRILHFMALNSIRLLTGP